MKRSARSTTTSRSPPSTTEKAQTYREQMIEAISEFDDKLFEKFVEGGTVTEAEILPASARLRSPRRFSR